MFVYLGQPYTHTSERIMVKRYKAALNMCAMIYKDGINVFSPIVHCHNIARQHGLPESFDFWRNVDFGMIAASSCIWVYQLDGWSQSVGLGQEISFARSIGKPVVQIEDDIRRDTYKLTQARLSHLQFVLKHDKHPGGQ